VGEGWGQIEVIRRIRKEMREDEGSVIRRDEK
jgi:hypothetical protein